MITMEATYAKKLGLPQYSSHQFSVTLRTEIADLSKVQDESAKLYAELQHAVDTSIQEVGYLPDGKGNGTSTHTNGHARTNGNGHSNSRGDVWKCSDKQKELILKIVDEHHLDKNEVESLARERFNTPVKVLNKLQASSLIQELLEKYPLKDQRNNGSRSFERSTR